nr:hypothetical protein [uncultured Megasphaera sp.]
MLTTYPFLAFPGLKQNMMPTIYKTNTQGPINAIHQADFPKSRSRLATKEIKHTEDTSNMSAISSPIPDLYQPLAGIKNVAIKLMTNITINLIRYGACSILPVNPINPFDTFIKNTSHINISTKTASITNHSSTRHWRDYR